jgi:hypothetical protein
MKLEAGSLKKGYGTGFPALVGAASSRDLRSKMPLPQKLTKCPKSFMITHGLSLKAFSLSA